jgi:hypothetical protein
MHTEYFWEISHYCNKDRERLFQTVRITVLDVYFYNI